MPSKILLVDDEPYIEDLVRQKFRKQIKENQFEFEYVSNGKSALEVLKNDDSFDLMLTDINMPVMDGLEATRLIRLMPGRAQLPIVAMTANAMLEDSQRCLAAGMNDYISKPFSPNTLWGLLLRWLTPPA